MLNVLRLIFVATILVSNAIIAEEPKKQVTEELGGKVTSYEANDFAHTTVIDMVKSGDTTRDTILDEVGQKLILKEGYYITKKAMRADPRRFGNCVLGTVKNTGRAGEQKPNFRMICFSDNVPKGGDKKASIHMTSSVEELFDQLRYERSRQR